MLRATAFASLPDTLVPGARKLDINLSPACERGRAAEVADTHRQCWLEENKNAMDAWNGHVAEHGLPLAAYRQS